MKTWQAPPFVKFSLLLHLALALGLALAPQAWPGLLALFLANHLALGLAGMWPRSRLLGANLVRLPPTAAARGEVAITIDDGPDPAVTPRVLEILATHDARATFFCIGERAAAHPALVQAIAAGGHEIANHGQRHRVLLPFAGPAGWRREIADGQATLAAIGGTPPRFYRAMAGLRNPFLDPVLQQLGLRLASWTRRGFDTRNADPAEVLARLSRELTAGDILLLHDGHAARGDNDVAVILSVLPPLLATLAARGLRPVTLSSACYDS